MTIYYTLGFLFCSKKENVVLIHKNRPADLAGQLNGVGGKIEGTESAELAMSREFLEETGVMIEKWNPFTKFSTNGKTIYCFTAVSDCKLTVMTDEIVAWYKISEIPKLPKAQNLEQLITAALSSLTIKPSHQEIGNAIGD